MARVMSTVIGFTKGTASGARIVLYLVRNFKSVSRSILDLGPRVMEPSFHDTGHLKVHLGRLCDSPASPPVVNEL